MKIKAILSGALCLSLIGITSAQYGSTFVSDEAGCEVEVEPVAVVEEACDDPAVHSAPPQIEVQDSRQKAKAAIPEREVPFEPIPLPLPEIEADSQAEVEPAPTPEAIPAPVEDVREETNKEQKVIPEMNDVIEPDTPPAGAGDVGKPVPKEVENNTVVEKKKETTPAPVVVKEDTVDTVPTPPKPEAPVAPDIQDVIQEEKLFEKTINADMDIEQLQEDDRALMENILDEVIGDEHIIEEEKDSHDAAGPEIGTSHLYRISDIDTSTPLVLRYLPESEDSMSASHGSAEDSLKGITTMMFIQHHLWTILFVSFLVFCLFFVTFL